jgi:hypothetical protein
MFRKAIALAIAGMVSLTGPALAADAQASAAKAAYLKQVKAQKADSIQRAAAPKGSDQMILEHGVNSNNQEFITFLLFGVISTWVIVNAFNNDEEPVSP